MDDKIVNDYEKRMSTHMHQNILQLNNAFYEQLADLMSGFEKDINNSLLYFPLVWIM